MNPISPDKGYAHPEKVVSTEWLAANLDNPGIRIIESNEDPLLYPSGHIPGAFEVDWALDLNDQETRDYLDREGFKSLMQKLGIENDTHLIFYGDKSNWWACYALWVFELFGHTNASILDGGRHKWEDESRPMTKERPVASPSFYAAPDRDDESARAFRDAVLSHVKEGGLTLDVRSQSEYTGERLHMENYPNEGALRGGHIPGAKNVSWARAVDPTDGTFLPVDTLKSLYEDETGLCPNQPVVTYCRIGERSSLTWFVLKYLLGYHHVRNYDGSWTEWGNGVGLPIEK